MKLSTNSRYGLRAMVDLAANYIDTPVALCAIAERQHISLSYLEQTFSMLRKAGLIKSFKGAQGGYALTNNADTITVAAILRILEGDLSIIDDSVVYCGLDPIKRCIKENIWDAINSKVATTLQSITLAQLAHDYQRMCGIALEYDI